MKTVKGFFISLSLLLSVTVGTLQLATPAYAAEPSAPASGSCVKGFLTFPAWYRGLNKSDSDCSLKSPSEFDSAPNKSDGIGTYVWIIVLNVIELVLQLIGYLAVFFIIYGGFRLMTRGDNAGEVEEARKTIMNAVVGLVISIASVALVNFIFRLFD